METGNETIKRGKKSNENLTQNNHDYKNSTKRYLLG
jgi:hypothetical protein